MIKVLIILFALFMLFKKIFSVIQKSIEKYRDKSKHHYFNVQVATTEREREKGLMWVKKLKEDQGMLFEYPKETYPSLWMKNTLIPLDAIFINNEGRVVYLAEDMKPHSKKPVKSKAKCKYVLEVKAGTIVDKEINKGDYIGTNVLSKNITNFNPPETKTKTKTKPSLNKKNKSSKQTKNRNNRTKSSKQTKNRNNKNKSN